LYWVQMKGFDGSIKVAAIIMATGKHARARQQKYQVPVTLSLPAHARVPRVIWLTGLPASGKTTLARALEAHLSSLDIPVACLDGDELRKGLCADLGLDDASRSENIRRAGEVAKLMHKAGLTVVCAFVSPFNADRQRVRRLFAPDKFIECYLSTPLDECVRRDPKGLYDRARKGVLSGLTGWDAPYEAPTATEFTFDTTRTPLATMVQAIVQHKPTHLL